MFFALAVIGLLTRKFIHKGTESNKRFTRFRQYISKATVTSLPSFSDAAGQTSRFKMSLSQPHNNSPFQDRVPDAKFIQTDAGKPP